MNEYICSECGHKDTYDNDGDKEIIWRGCKSCCVSCVQMKSLKHLF